MRAKCPLTAEAPVLIENWRNSSKYSGAHKYLETEKDVRDFREGLSNSHPNVTSLLKKTKADVNKLGHYHHLVPDFKKDEEEEIVVPRRVRKDAYSLNRWKKNM